MTLFFNLENLDKEAGTNYRRYLFLLYQLYYKKLPSRKDKHRPAKLKLTGNSFLLNVKPLFTEIVDIAYVIQYIRLAGMRDYTLYKQYSVTSLPLSYFPDVNIDNIKHNPLLTITEDSIFFKHERK
jgi:hypothetical protein